MSVTSMSKPSTSQTGAFKSHAPKTGASISVDDIHLAPEEMDRLLYLDCPHELAFEWLAHLVACKTCRHRLTRHCPEDRRRILDRFLLLSDAREATVQVHPSAYDRVFERIRVRDLSPAP